MRRPFMWLLDTVAIVAAATVGVCVFVRGAMSEPPPRIGKRTKEARPDWGLN